MSSSAFAPMLTTLYKRKGWTNSVVPLVNSLLWGHIWLSQHFSLGFRVICNERLSCRFRNFKSWFHTNDWEHNCVSLKSFYFDFYKLLLSVGDCLGLNQNEWWKWCRIIGRKGAPDDPFLCQAQTSALWFFWQLWVVQQPHTLPYLGIKL